MVENQQGRIPETPILIDAILTRHPWTSVCFDTVMCVFYPYLLFVQLQHAGNHTTVDQGYIVPGTLQRDCHLPKGRGAVQDKRKYRRLARCVVIYSAPSNGLTLPLLCKFIFWVSLPSLQMLNCFDSVRQQGSCYLAKFPVNWCARKRNAVEAEECRMNFQQGSSCSSCFHRSPPEAQWLRLHPHFPEAGLSPTHSQV